MDRETRPYDKSPKKTFKMDIYRGKRCLTIYSLCRWQFLVGSKGGRGLWSARGGEHAGTAKHVPQKPPVTQARRVNPHDNASLFTVIYHSCNRKALYLQFLYQVNTIYQLSIIFLTPCISIMLSLL